MTNLNNSKSSSCDNFFNFFVKICRNEILLSLLHVFNLSIEHGMFPSKLKKAKVIPLYKGGDVTCMSNYRPISLLSPFAKLLERLMYSRVMSSFLVDIVYCMITSLAFVKGTIQRLPLLTLLI